ncbi:MAG TPA: phosphoribosylformylglycinamidine synthase subunit PurS, partial [Tepidisphaeraceae bacterium]|nr:phosphoribosylformylglycinamidine synthase subunit PurS [Tepidisphaeraceae bacterium]
ARIFLMDTDATAEQVAQIARELLADPVVEQAELVTAAPRDIGRSRIEVHLKPGVMDPVANSTEMAIRDMGLPIREVRTGRSYLIEGQVSREELSRIASRVLANGVVESVHFEAFIPKEFPAGREYKLQLRYASILKLTEKELLKLSREKHLFLSLAEMKAIQDYFKKQNREPTDIELETLAQTWSEHCVHKTLKSSVDLEIRDEAGKVVAKRHYDNLIKDTIFKSTMELMEEARRHKGTKAQSGEFCLSVFVDNAGVVVFDEQDAVCFKVETHNHPSAIEPYGGSATGIGGVIRDILGTGLAAKPIANTDVFCVGSADYNRENLPKGVLHPKRILQQIVAGVRDYGNRMGIPTVNGGVYFDDRYLGNPLVFCGCVGLIPRNKINKRTLKGDAIVVMGGRTGRDGIHGATPPARPAPRSDTTGPFAPPESATPYRESPSPWNSPPGPSPQASGEPQCGSGQCPGAPQ